MNETLRCLKNDTKEKFMDKGEEGPSFFKCGNNSES